MKENMLQSQFDTLEEPEEALVLDMSMSLHDMLDTILMIATNKEEAEKMLLQR